MVPGACGRVNCGVYFVSIHIPFQFLFEYLCLPPFRLCILRETLIAPMTDWQLGGGKKML